MVVASRIESGPQVISASVRKSIQNHSNADLSFALKETNVDPNETAKKLLNQDPFHQVKRKRDRRNENSGLKGNVAAEARKISEILQLPKKSDTYSGTNAQRGGYTRTGATREFQVVPDNRVDQNYIVGLKPVQSSVSPSERLISNVSVNSKSTGTFGHQKPPVPQTRAHDSKPHHATSSKSSVVEICTASSDPDHLPSGVVGPHRQSSENSAEPSTI